MSSTSASMLHSPPTPPASSEDEPLPDNPHRYGLSIYDLERLSGYLIGERDDLKIELKCANVVINELKARADELERTNEQLTRQLTTKSTKPNTVPQKNKWIWDIWLPTLEDAYFLAQAENLLRRSEWQRAIAQLSRVLMERRMMVRTRINAKLLMCTSLRLCMDVDRALLHAEEAVQLADRKGIADLLHKAQFYRATCLFDLDFFEEAGWCFSLAVGAPDFESRIAEWSEKAISERDELPSNDSRRYLRDSFHRIPPAREYGNADILY